MNLIIIAGMSGAGRSTAVKVMEDLGYGAIDNLPFPLLEHVVKIDKLDLPSVIGLDARSFHAGIENFPILHQYIIAHYRFTLVFLECRTEMLQRRYSISRRRHPIESHSLEESIAQERLLLAPFKALADQVIDTSEMSIITLGRLLKNEFSLNLSPQLEIRVLSFSYRRGLPPEADVVLDARFLQNPYYNEVLKPLTGRDKPVQEFLCQDPEWNSSFKGICNFLSSLLTGVRRAGRSYLTIAVGCTGGCHRSVYLAESIAGFLKTQGEKPFLAHLELEHIDS